MNFILNLTAHLVQTKIVSLLGSVQLVQVHMLTSTSTKFSRLKFFSFSAQSNFICPEKDGYFEDTKQCDKYYDCYDGIPEERLCPDGLVFDPFSRKREPCDHYFNVDCGDRLDLRK